MQYRDLHRQYEAMQGEMDAAVMEAVRSGAYIMGPQVAELECQLAEYVGVKHCISCANGTDALTMAMMALGIGQGDAVFVPDFTFFATAEAVAMTGATPIFVDICADTFNIDPDDLVRKHRDALAAGLKPKAVTGVDLYGLPADYDRLREYCDGAHLLLIEDGAQGFGGRLGGRKACSLADIATTSFFPAKPLGCYGDGGAIFTNDDACAELLRSLRVHGRGADKYDNVRLGFNSRLDTVQAAVLLVKLRHLDREVEAVNRAAARYSTLLQGKVQTPTVPDGCLSAWAHYTIQTSRRDELQARLKAAGIPTMVYYPRTMSQQRAFAHLGQKPCPTALHMTGTALSLPIHPYITDEEIETVVSLI